MLSTLHAWTSRVFADPEATALTIILLAFGLVLAFAGGVLAPVFTSIVLAYLLLWIADALEKQGMSRGYSVWSAFILFLGLFLASIFFLLPLLWQQLELLIEELPNILFRIQQALYLLPERFPEYFSKRDIDSFMMDLAGSFRGFGRNVLSASISSIPSIIAISIYAVLVPIMVFFFLKDKAKILQWASSFLPKERSLMKKVWAEVDGQLGNYIRGKVVEMIIVFIGTLFCFWAFKLKYAVLLSALVGLSVAVPYVGAIIVTIPVAMVGIFQYGLTTELFWLLFSYTVVQVIDGNVLVPLLFSEAVSLHPLAIIISIIFFGGFWGIWGVFFAIPLAILTRALVYAWPLHKT